jgi:hypothetical protein
MMISGFEDGLDKKEVALLAGDITSAFFLRVLLLLNVLPLFFCFLILEAEFAAALFEKVIDLITFFFRLS